MNPSYKTYSVTADCCLYLIYNIRFNYQNIFISDHAMELINMTHVFLEKKMYIQHALSVMYAGYTSSVKETYPCLLHLMKKVFEQIFNL